MKIYLKGEISDEEALGFQGLGEVIGFEQEVTQHLVTCLHAFHM